MSSLEFAEWMALFNLEPFGDVRADLRSAIVASTVANVNRGPKDKHKYSPEEFMPKFEREKKRSSWQDQLAMVEMLNVAFGGRDLRKKS